MRIHLHLSDRASQSTPSDTFDDAQVPPALARLTPNGELVLIELQGSLEMSAPDDCGEGAHLVGTLSFEKGIAEHPILTVSHHRLEGKVVSLQKPLAVLEKRKRTLKGTSLQLNAEGEHEDVAEASTSIDREDAMQETMADAITAASRGGALTSRVRIRAETPASSADEADGDRSRDTAKAGDATPPAGENTPPAHKRRRLDGLDTLVADPTSSSPPRGLPARDALDFSSSPSRIDAAAGDPARAQHDAEDRSSRLGSSSAHRAEEISRRDAVGKVRAGPTSTFYEVVSIVRKKIIFSKRPEPHVRSR